MHATPFVWIGAATLALLALQGPQDPTTDIRFIRGRNLFDHNFHRIDGVGSPELNADSCRACHRDPTMGGAGPLELNVSRFGDDGGGTGPFQNLPGGQGLSKLRPPYVAGREEHTFAATVFEQRQTPALFGAGLIDSIPDAVIEANQDPNDADGDGVRGVARHIDVGGTIEVGRFGWKAQVPHIVDFVRDAAFGELGLTTPDDGRGFGARTDADGSGDPELSFTQVDDLTFFIDNLPAPARTGSTAPEVAIGEALFTSIGCAKCHRPELAGASGPVKLYSDLLLHKVADANFRGMAEPGADVGVYRTPPLWGIVHTAPYLHDGRAETLRDAITLHKGEAAAITQAFLALTASDQAALVAFLQDL